MQFEFQTPFSQGLETAYRRNRTEAEQLFESFCSNYELFNPLYLEDPYIIKAIEFSTIIHANQIRRRTQAPVFLNHICKVAQIASTESLSHPHINYSKAVIIAFLHDTVEDGVKKGIDSNEVLCFIRAEFGEEISEQIGLLSVFVNTGNKEEDDIAETNIWLTRIQSGRLTPESMLVKIGDIFINGDGEPLRPTKQEQRIRLLTALDSATDEQFHALVRTMLS